MTRRRLTLLALLAAGLAAVAGTLTGRYVGVAGSGPRLNPAKAKPAELLVVQNGHNSFGEVWETKDFAWSFPVVNRSDRPVTVEKITGSCTCLSVSPERFTIGPGQTQVINVRIDFTLKPRKDENAAFIVEYRTSEDVGRPMGSGQWIITGKVRPFVMLDAPLDFGRHSVLAQPLTPLTVEARFGTMVDSVTVEPLGPSVRATADLLGPNGRYRLVVSPVESFSVGRIDTAVLLKIKAASGEERAERIPVTGLIVRDVEVFPPAYPGGGKLVGECFEFDVTASSATRSPFTVVGAKAVGEGLSVTPRGDRYVVRQDCLADGVRIGRVEFEIEAADGRYTASVAVDYTGFQP